jgi:hypothetical protein
VADGVSLWIKKLSKTRYLFPVFAEFDTKKIYQKWRYTEFYISEVTLAERKTEMLCLRKEIGGV